VADPDSGLAALVRARRGELGLTQAQLAARAGIVKRTVQYLESGQKQPRAATLAMLRDALGWTAADIPQALEPAPREHGTPKGYGQHYRAGEDPCGPCHDAITAGSRERRRRIRAEQEQRRARWRLQDQEAGRG